MKKVFKMFALAAMVFGLTMTVACKDDPDNNGDDANAEPVLLDETFDTDLSAWTLIDADGDSFNWMSYPYGVEESFCAASASYDNPSRMALEPDNYLVSAELDIKAKDYTLTWYAAAQDSDYTAEHYSVYAGTVADGVFTPVATLYEETIASADFEQRSVSLADLKGQKVCIAFRHHNCTDNFVMKIDNVKVAREGAKAPATYPAVGGETKK